MDDREKQIEELAKFLGDYNMQKGSIDYRYIPFVCETAAALYAAGYRKVAEARGKERSSTGGRDDDEYNR